MVTDVYMIRTPDGFRPNSLDDAELIKRWKLGDIAKLSITKPRNYKYHQKFFVMLDVAFDHWEPAVTEYKGMPVQKNKERFRKDLIIAAGFHALNVNAVTGELRYDAESIAFASMDEMKFQHVYSKVVDVVLQKILTNYTDEELERVVGEIMAFT